MRASLIISVYKNTSFLRSVLDSVRLQTFIPDEIIVSEDGDSLEMNDFIRDYDHRDLNIIHLTQKDKGWRKNLALNRAVVTASGDYLIFIDGDCVLHTKFIENHVRMAHADNVLAGKRVKLGPAFSRRLQEMSVDIFQRQVIKHSLEIRKDGGKFVEEALYIPLTPLSRSIIRMLGISSIKGCNFSCFKRALLDINGFDEDYVQPAVGEDIDLVWRFKAAGYRIVSVKHFAVQYHLYHIESWSSQDENMALLRQKQAVGEYRCRNGINKLAV